MQSSCNCESIQFSERVIITAADGCSFMHDGILRMAVILFRNSLHSICTCAAGVSTRGLYLLIAYQFFSNYGL